MIYNRTVSAACKHVIFSCCFCLSELVQPAPSLFFFVIHLFTHLSIFFYLFCSSTICPFVVSSFYQLSSSACQQGVGVVEWGVRRHVGIMRAMDDCQANSMLMLTASMLVALICRKNKLMLMHGWRQIGRKATVDKN